MQTLKGKPSPFHFANYVQGSILNNDFETRSTSLQVCVLFVMILTSFTVNQKQVLLQTKILDVANLFIYYSIKLYYSIIFIEIDSDAMDQRSKFDYLIYFTIK